MDHVTIRPATLADAGNILEIYAYYVQNTAITFEYKVPSLEEFRGRMENTLRKYPYLVAVRDGKIAGYAYAGAFVGRAAYDWSAEMTVYLDHNARKRGLGRTLYTALEDALRDMGVLNLYACIGYPEEEDEYLTQNSAGFHTHLGFGLAGRFHRCGYKFGRWYDVVWMEKVIGEHRAVQPRIRRFSALKRYVLHTKKKDFQLEALLFQSSVFYVRYLHVRRRLAAESTKLAHKLPQVITHTLYLPTIDSSLEDT